MSPSSYFCFSSVDSLGRYTPFSLVACYVWTKAVAAAFRPLVQVAVNEYTHINLSSILTGWYIKKPTIQTLDDYVAALQKIKTKQTALLGSEPNWIRKFQTIAAGLPTYKSPHQTDPGVPQGQLCFRSRAPLQAPAPIVPLHSAGLGSDPRVPLRHRAVPE